MKSLTRSIGRNNRSSSCSFKPISRFRLAFSENETNSLAAQLPYDILQEIFQCCMALNPFRAYIPNNTLPLLILCHICASWRIAAFGDHRLWKTLHMALRPTYRGFPYNGIGVPQEQLNKIVWWTTRTSGDYTYSFMFSNRGHIPTAEVGKKYVSFREVFRVPAVRSAGSVALIVNPWLLAEMRRMRRPFAQLGLSSFLCRDDIFRSDRKFTLPPTLGRLAAMLCPRFTFPFAQLTHLYMLKCSWPRQFRDLLESCKNVQCAMLHIGEGHIHVSKPIIHANLRQLVARCQGASFPDLFKGILFPSLHSLRLSAVPNCYEDSYDRTMHEEYYEISLYSLHKILQSTPSLKELRLHCCIKFRSAEFSAFSIQTSDSLSTFAPHLEHLAIEEPLDMYSCHPPYITEFMQSRWLCANWGANLPLPSTSGSGKWQLLVEIIMDRYYQSRFQEPLEILARNSYHPNLHLTFEGSQEMYLVPVGGDYVMGKQWKELAMFRIPIE